jgi:hypothetical protein
MDETDAGGGEKKLSPLNDALQQLPAAGWCGGNPAFPNPARWRVSHTLPRSRHATARKLPCRLENALAARIC